MRLEEMWYEISPYLYLIGGSAATLDSQGSLLMAGSGLILFVAAATVIGLRWVYRQGTVRTGGGALEESRYVNLITQEVFFDKRRVSRHTTPAPARRAG